jgi:citronellol/citronellal dehydrogenase
MTDSTGVGGEPRRGDLTGRVALVTGASRGIGAAIAERFAAAGATVAVTARTVEPGTSPLAGTILETVERIRSAGGTAVAVAADISRADERERLVAETVSSLGPIDVLVSNAAVTYFLPVTEFTAKRLQLMFDVQVAAPLHLAQLVLPGMAEKGMGWILNISSGAARHPAIPPDPARHGGGTVYGMCKAAVERFSTGLASEVYADNVAVNALSPNRVVPTPGTVFHHLVRPDDPDQVVEPPAVMAEAALALCSGPPRSLTGRIAYSQDLLNELGVTVDPAGTSPVGAA